MHDENNNAWQEKAGLTVLEPGPRPIIPKRLWAEIQEWITAWRHADALREAGLKAPGGLLLHGPPGTGKTMLAAAVGKYMGRETGVLDAHNVLTSMFGESAANVAKAFRAADAAQGLLIVEEIDVLGSARDLTGSGVGGNETRNITVALMRSLEAVRTPVIATTNCKGLLDPALLRRFEMQLEIPALDEQGRALVLRKILECEPPAELVALPLVESILLAHRMRRAAFLARLEGDRP